MKFEDNDDLFEEGKNSNKLNKRVLVTIIVVLVLVCIAVFFVFIWPSLRGSKEDSLKDTEVFQNKVQDALSAPGHAVYLPETRYTALLEELYNTYGWEPDDTGIPFMKMSESEYVATIQPDYSLNVTIIYNEKDGSYSLISEERDYDIAD